MVWGARTASFLLIDDGSQEKEFPPTDRLRAQFATHRTADLLPVRTDSLPLPWLCGPGAPLTCYRVWPPAWGPCSAGGVSSLGQQTVARRARAIQRAERPGCANIGIHAPREHINDVCEQVAHSLAQHACRGCAAQHTEPDSTQRHTGQTLKCYTGVSTMGMHVMILCSSSDRGWHTAAVGPGMGLPTNTTGGRQSVGTLTSVVV